jgi:hypothetical protein
MTLKTLDSGTAICKMPPIMALEEMSSGSIEQSGNDDSVLESVPTDMPSDSDIQRVAENVLLSQSVLQINIDPANPGMRLDIDNKTIIPLSAAIAEQVDPKAPEKKKAALIVMITKALRETAMNMLSLAKAS